MSDQRYHVPFGRGRLEFGLPAPMRGAVGTGADSARRGLAPDHGRPVAGGDS
jgi:hypothetical protein